MKGGGWGRAMDILASFQVIMLRCSSFCVFLWLFFGNKFSLRFIFVDSLVGLLSVVPSFFVVERGPLFGTETKIEFWESFMG